MPQHDAASPEARVRWKPAQNQQYYLILGDGQIHQLAWQSTPFDRAAWEFGNCFRTRRDAEGARDRMKAFLWGLHAQRDKNAGAPQPAP